jgi:hypothetical protein
MIYQRDSEINKKVFFFIFSLLGKVTINGKWYVIALPQHFYNVKNPCSKGMETS